MKIKRGKNSKGVFHFVDNGRIWKVNLLRLHSRSLVVNVLESRN